MITDDLSVNSLTEWIGLFLPNLSPDGAGGYVEAPPANVAEDFPAAVQFNSGRESYLSGQQADTNELEVVIRYEPGITTAYRLSWRSAFFDIVTVENVDAADMWLRFIVVKREAGSQ